MNRSFKVVLNRISHASTTVTLTAVSAEEASEKALERSGDLEYSEKSADYEIENCYQADQDPE